MSWPRPALVFLSLTVAIGMVHTSTAAEGGGGAEPQVVHNVYFSLNDNSSAATEALVAACKKYLTGHPGTVFFAAGPLATELNRPVNDRDFDVALTVVFKNKAAHDAYQTAERHLKFIAENKPTWKKVRVFDALANHEREPDPCRTLRVILKNPRHRMTGIPVMQ